MAKYKKDKQKNNSKQNPGKNGVDRGVSGKISWSRFRCGWSSDNHNKSKPNIFVDQLNLLCET